MKALFIIGLLVVAIAVPLAIVFFHAKLKDQSVLLANDWSVFLKKWSTWLNVTAAGFGTWLLASPDFFIHLWAQIPDEWKSSIPPEYVKLLPMMFVVASIVVSNIKQQKLAREQESKNVEKAILKEQEPDPVVSRETPPVDRSRTFIGK